MVSHSDDFHDHIHFLEATNFVLWCIFAAFRNNCIRATWSMMIKRIFWFSFNHAREFFVASRIVHFKIKMTSVKRKTLGCTAEFHLIMWTLSSFPCDSAGSSFHVEIFAYRVQLCFGFFPLTSAIRCVFDISIVAMYPRAETLTSMRRCHLFPLLET